MAQPSTQEKTDAKKFGTFAGVFTPSALTIFGVIMYLRSGWVLGNVGLTGTILIVALASSVTLLTALSISAIATNMRVAGGGAYYMISRSLGLEAGAAVGIPLYLAQALGIPFYLAGFAESVTAMMPGISPILVGVIALVILFAVTFKSADLALKSQFLIFAIIVASLVSFFAGSPPDPETLESLRVQDRDVSFWVAFAVFFPAVTGILSGVSMSGDLKDPGKSLPIGTIAAVVVGFLVYVAIPIYLADQVPDRAALKNSLILQKVAMYEPLIVAGIWGATLSSALGSFLGAPRTLQALSRDGVLSKHLRILSRGAGKDNAPAIATALTFIVALTGLLLGDLNALAPVLSMFFLTAYGVLNVSAGIESLIANPAWRPRFRTPFYVSLFGALLCFSVMFMIDPGSTILALAVSFGVYYYMQRKNLRTNFGDMRRGILMFLARYSIFRLAELPENPKSWRPNLLVFSGSPTARWYLIELADAITHGKGFLTVATILPTGTSAENRMSEVRRTIHDYLRKRNVPALVNISIADDVPTGVTRIVRQYGLGSLVPNTILMGGSDNDDSLIQYAETICRLYQEKRNVILVRKSSQDTSGSPIRNRTIDVWWGRQRENAGLSLALGYMLQNSPEWAGAELRLKSIATSEEERDSARSVLNDFLLQGRLDAEAKVFVTEQDRIKIFAEIKAQSTNADLVFMGMEPPKLDQFVADKQAYLEEYAGYYRRLIRSVEGFPTTAFVLTAEDVKFVEIFA